LATTATGLAATAFEAATGLEAVPAGAAEAPAAPALARTGAGAALAAVPPLAAGAATADDEEVGGLMKTGPVHEIAVHDNPTAMIVA
jgi:hypothetical protein